MQINDGVNFGVATQQLVMSVALNQQQLALVNQHLVSLQAMSGAQFQVAAGTQGVYHLVGRDMMTFV
jgi:hypothetical protein